MVIDPPKRKSGASITLEELHAQLRADRLELLELNARMGIGDLPSQGYSLHTERRKELDGRVYHAEKAIKLWGQMQEDAQP